MNPDLWSVFLSHSTNDNRDGIARQVLLRLQSELEKLRFHVWVDHTELRDGDEWRRKIRDAIATSHVGVVLLDERALHRRYVQHEADVMQAQPSDRNYRIIPVLIGLSRETVEQSDAEPFNTLITETQYVELKRPDDVEGVVAEVVDVLGSRELGLLPDGEMRLVKRIAKMLPTDPAEAIRLASLFKGAHPVPPLLATEVLAHRMLQAQLDSPVGAVIRHWQAHFVQAHRDFRRTLVNLIKPSWITLDQAEPIVPPQQASNRVGVLATAPGTTPEPISLEAGVDLVRRATHCDDRVGKVQSFAPVPMGPEPYQLEEDLRKVPWGPDRTGRTKYLVLEAGKFPSTRLDGVRCAHRLWPNVVVVLVIGPDAESEDLDAHLGTPCYCRASLPRDGEEKAAAAIEEICEDLMINTGAE